MKRTISFAAALALVVGLSSGVAEAGVPFINLEGVGGVAFNPLAYPAVEGEGVKAGFLEIAKPRVGGWYVDLDQSTIDWTTAGVATAVNQRLELSFGYEAIAIEGAANVHKLNTGAKALLLRENAFGTKFLPAVSVGAVWKSTNVPRTGDVDREGLDVYLVATKLVTQLPRPVLVSAGLLSTKAMVDGIIGFQDERKIVGFGNLDVVATSWLVLGVEVKQGPDYGDYQDALYYNLHAGYVVSKNLTLAAAYTHAGAKKADPLGFGGGFVLGVQQAF